MENQPTKKPRQTAQKSVIINVLKSMEEPATAEKIHENAKLSLPKLALTTVYRNLDAMVENDMIKRYVYEDGVSRYTLSNEHMHRLVCLGCNKCVVLDSCPVSKLEGELKRETGFEISKHNLEIFGYCPDCKRK